MFRQDVSELWLFEFLHFLINTPQGFMSTLNLIFFAALSYHLGQSIILYINHVNPRRFFFSLITSIALYVLGYLIWVITLDILLEFIIQDEIAIVDLAKVVAVAYIPRLFDILLLIPHFGSHLVYALHITSYLLLSFLLEHHYGLTINQALLCSSIGFLITSFFRHSISKPYIVIAKFFKKRIQKAHASS